VGLPALPRAAVIPCHEHQIARGHLWLPDSGRQNRAQGARERATRAIRETDRAEAEAWSIRMEGYRGPWPKDTPIWKLEASLKCRSCRKGQYAPPVHMIRLTEQPQTLPYVWVHPDEER
jgi:hypothetical protein